MLSISAQLAEDTGTVDTRQILAISYNHLGDLARARDHLEAAQCYCEQVLTIFEQMAKELGAVAAYDDLQSTIAS